MNRDTVSETPYLLWLAHATLSEVPHQILTFQTVRALVHFALVHAIIMIITCSIIGLLVGQRWFDHSLVLYLATLLRFLDAHHRHVHCFVWLFTTYLQGGEAI